MTRPNNLSRLMIGLLALNPIGCKSDSPSDGDADTDTETGDGDPGDGDGDGDGFSFDVSGLQLAARADANDTPLTEVPHEQSALLNGYLQPYTIIDIGGQQVALIGIESPKRPWSRRGLTRARCCSTRPRPPSNTSTS